MYFVQQSALSHTVLSIMGVLYHSSMDLSQVYIHFIQQGYRNGLTTKEMMIKFCSGELLSFVRKSAGLLGAASFLYVVAICVNCLCVRRNVSNEDCSFQR